LPRYPEAHIVAVEPAPDNFALLYKNSLGGDVDPRQMGIGSTDGCASLRNPGGGGMSYRTNESQNGTGLGIEILSFNTLLVSKPAAVYTTFLLKVDIKGAEKSLFPGNTSGINQFPLIIMEPHDWLLPGQQTSVDFFRFHASAGREFSMKHENIASIAHHPTLIPAPTTAPIVPSTVTAKVA